ncbi:MAG: metallophosphatase family protein [Gemmatimonadetes bacterium]|nr:metallophosphatase family protein [Gemmatimonadota bacterium]
MRVAAIYDIHGNLPALEAVLDDVRAAGVRRIVMGGDVLPGPFPEGCLARLRDVEIPLDCIHGNGDRETLAHVAGNPVTSVPEAFREILRWTARRLSIQDRDWVAGWPATLRMEIPAIGRLLFCHATPRNDTDIFTARTPEERLAPIFDSTDAQLVVCGHTHMQFDRTIGGTRVVNAGSVGMPYGEAGAYWLLLGPGVELRRTAYDFEAASRRIEASDYPGAREFAQRFVIRPPPESEALEMFGRAELK